MEPVNLAIGMRRMTSAPVHAVSEASLKVRCGCRARIGHVRTVREMLLLGCSLGSFMEMKRGFKRKPANQLDDLVGIREHAEPHPSCQSQAV